mmetsp:Transcript_52918/g.105143  ORF Transcript_52918/g.105143 Transcript_52918/m.105143 type:complete len:400 (+) Transcript_52918:81-1280(+)
MGRPGMFARLGGRIAPLRSLRRSRTDCQPLQPTACKRRPQKECSVDDAAPPLRFSTLCGLRSSGRSRSGATRGFQQQQQQQQHWRQGLSQPLVGMDASCVLNAAEESTQCKERLEVSDGQVANAGNKEVHTSTLDELGQLEPASEAFLRTSADMKASGLDGTAVEGPVCATQHDFPANDAATATAAATAPPAPVVPRLRRSLSSPAVLCQRDKVVAPVVPECTPRPHLEKTTSIGCPGEFPLQRNGSTSLRELDVFRDRDSCAGPVAAQGSQVVDLEKALAVCEQQLEEIEQRTQALHVMPVNACETASAAGESAPRDMEAASLRLSRDFEEVAAEALELGCSRVPGAMDVFEQANAGIERIASCLRQCRDVQASAKGAWPSTLDAHARGPMFQAVGGG